MQGFSANFTLIPHIAFPLTKLFFLAFPEFYTAIPHKKPLLSVLFYTTFLYNA